MLGFGLALAPNAMAALRELGVADAVKSQSAEPRRAEARRPDGTVLKRVELPPGGLGGPTVVALRPALHGALLAAVGAEAIALDCTATGFTVHGTGVRLQLADGLPAEGDVLIGADGAGSFIRRVLHPQEPPPRPSGLIAVRGAVHGVRHHLGDRDAVFYLGPGIESMLVRASETAIYWFLSMAMELLPTDTRDPAAILARMAPQFDETFRAVTAATEDLRVDELVDRDPLPFWGKGPVTLLGDAAHPLLPQTGQGAAQALVDAVTLGKALRDARRRRAGVAGVRAPAPVPDGGAGRAGTPHGPAHADAESRGVLPPRGGVAPGPGRNDRAVLRQDQPPRRHRLTLIVARSDRRALEVSCRRWTAVARSRR